jgi:hypothetical protein
MRQKLRSRLTFANVVSVIALFAALGGTGAWATHEVILSSDIRDGEVKTPDLANLGVTNPKLATGGVTAGKLATGAVTSAKVLDNSLTGNDVNESTLAGLDGADGFNTFCDPNSTTFVDCGAATTVTLGRAMSVLVIVTSHFSSFFGNPPNVGNCRLMENGVAVSGDHTIGELDPDRDTGLDASGGVTQGGMNLVDVRSLAAGTYTFRVDCNETASDIAFNNISVAAVELAQD